VNGPEAVAAFMFFGGTFWVLRPVAAAVAKRIAGEHRKPGMDPAEREEILSELQHVREEVAELAERMVAELRKQSRALGKCGREELWRGQLGLELDAMEQLAGLIEQVEKKLDELAARNLLAYLAEQKEITGAVPSDRLRIQVAGDFERGLSLRMARLTG